MLFIVTLDEICSFVIKYNYGFNGVRTSKTLKSGNKGAFAVNYIYDGNNLIAEQRGNKLITYFYGVDGVAGFEYEENTYIYRKNVQGDITHIYKKLADGSLELVARYVYDAWGNHDVLDAEDKIVDRTASVIANINPFRYRGYYYDVETGLYFLQTRYYDPETGRFISQDSLDYADPETVNGLNLYAYCGNNPVMNVDPTGEFWDLILDLIFLVWDIYDLCTNEGYKNWENWVALVVDVVFAVVPFVTGGGGQVVKIGNKVDNAFDVANTVNKLDNFKDLQKVTAIGESMNRIQLTTRYLGHADDFYHGFSAYNKLSDLGKGGKVLAEIGGKSSNALWLYSKLRTGYQVLDMGIDIARTGRSSSYIMERIISWIWKYRNSWKWIYHIF